MGLGMGGVFDLWPNVGYDAWCGYNSETYPGKVSPSTISRKQDSAAYSGLAHELSEAQEQLVWRVESLVASFKRTAQDHGLNLPFVDGLSCVPCKEAHAGCHLLTFLDPEDRQSKSLHARVSKIKAEIDVSESPTDGYETSIRLEVNGLEAQGAFTFTITVNRYPEKSETSSYENR